MASYHLNEIELEHVCDPDPQLYDSVSSFQSILTLISLPDLDPIPEPTLIHVPIDLETEPSIFDSHILLMGNECEFQFFDLEPTLKPKLTLNLNLI